MKPTIFALACLSVLLGVADAQPTRNNVTGSQAKASDEQTACGRRETISHTWREHGVEVSFYRNGNNPRWTIAVRDNWPVIYQALAPGTNAQKTWGVSDSKLATAECLCLIEQSVTAFRAEKPSSQFETLLIEIQLVKELWNETLQKLGERMARQEGQKPADIFDVPNEIRKTIDRVVSESPTAAEITALMRKLGVSAKFIGMAEHTLFRDSLTGQSWSEIARLPGVGILSPGTIEIELKAPKPSPAEVPKAK